jgi:hypothetical protein
LNDYNFTITHWRAYIYVWNKHDIASLFSYNKNTKFHHMDYKSFSMNGEIYWEQNTLEIQMRLMNIHSAANVDKCWNLGVILIALYTGNIIICLFASHCKYSDVWVCIKWQTHFYNYIFICCWKTLVIEGNLSQINLAWSTVNTSLHLQSKHHLSHHFGYKI